jgi:hypothetical protein
LRKTRLCRGFETTGECPYGENCWFAHGEADRKEFNSQTFHRRPHPFAKTKMCKFITTGGTCPYNDTCNFAHTNMELRQGLVMMFQPRNMNYMMRNKRPIDSDRYKTRLCKAFNIHGFCKYGDTCAFAHGPQDLRGNHFAPPQMAYGDFQPHYYPDMNAQYNPAAQQPFMFNAPPQGQPQPMVQTQMMQ